VSDDSFEAAWFFAADVDGWLSEDQARQLFAAAATVDPGRAVVEIGSHHGRSMIVLARGVRAGVRVVAVDPFDDSRWGGGAESQEVFRANLRRAGVGDRVEVVRCTSADAARGWDGEPLGLVYLDGAHDRQSVLADIDGWSGRVAEGGLLVLHDAFSSVGVTQAMLRRFFGRRRFTYQRSVGSLVLFRRDQASPAAAVVGGLRLAARLPYFGRNIAVKFALRRRWPRICRALGHVGDGDPY